MIYEFTPTQDLHGYDSPWPAGGGKNMLPVTATTQTINGVTFTVNDDGTITVNGTATANAALVVYGTNQSSADDIAIASESVISTGTSAITGVVWKSGGGTTFNIGTYTISAGTVLYGFGIRVLSGETANNITVKPMLRLSTESATFAPYSNICPPEGYNIWDPNNQEYVQVYSGYVNANTRELYLRPVYKEYAGEELVGPWMSSLDPYEEDTTPTEGAFVIDFGGELTSYEITPFMLQTLLNSLGIRQHFTNGAGLLNSLMDQAQGRVRSEEELLHISRPLNVIAIGDQLPAGLTFKPISKDVLPGLPGKFIR